MEVDKAIEVIKAYLQWNKTGVYVPYNKLNTELFRESLQLLIDMVQSEKGMGEK